MHEHTLFLRDVQGSPPKICRFAVKDLPPGLAKQARRADFALKPCKIFTATLCFRNWRSGKSLWQSYLQELSHSCSNGGKPMVQRRQNSLTNYKMYPSS